MKRVLIVDDAIIMRLAIRTILERNGYVIAGEAVNGQDGVEKYKALRPDIVTMDFTMPIIDGIQALKSIREFDHNAKVIMISAMGQEILIKDAIINGAISFIVKPFKETNVMQALKKI